MAGNRIKGITIEIDGDTSKLTDSLKKVDGQLKTTQNNLRDINRLLKLDPGNTDLLTQKQKNLKDAIQNTKDRLTELKKVQQDSVTPEEWDAVQREIVETEQKLEGLKKQYSDFGSVSGQKIKVAGQKIQDFGSNIQKVGKKIMPLSLGVTAIGTAAIGAAKELDNGYDTIITKTGATGETLEALQGQMDNVFRTLPIDAETAGIAIGEVNTRFALTGDTLGAVSADFIRFAEINNTDLNSAIDNVDSIMTKFGVDTDQVGNVLGLMTDAGQRTGISMDTLEATLGKNGATLKEMGLGLTESVNLLANFEANGIDSSTAIAALRKAQQNATASGKDMNTALTEGISKIQNASSETEALNTATELFGAKGAAEMTQAIQEGRLSLDDLTGSLDTYSGTVQDTYNATLDPWDKMKTAINDLMLAGSDLAGELFEVLAPVIDGVVQKVREFTDWFRGLNDTQKDAVVKIGLVVAAAGPLISILGTAISGIGGVVSAVGGLVGMITGGGGVVAAAGSATAAIGGVSAAAGSGGLIATLGGLASAAAPFLVGGAVVAGIVGGGVLIYKNWDKIKEGAKKLGDGLKKSFGNIKKSVGDAWDKVKQKTSDAWGKVKQSTSDAWGKVKEKVGGVASGLKEKVTGAWDKLKSSTSNVFGNIKTSITGVWDNLKGSTSTTVGNIQTTAANTFGNLRNSITNIFGGIRTATSGAWSNIKTSIVSATNGIKSSAAGSFNSLKSTISGAFNGIKSSTSGAWNSVYNTITSKARSAKNSVSSIMGGLKSSVTGAFSSLSRSIGNPFSKVVNAASSAVRSIKNAFSGAKLSLPRIKTPHISVSWSTFGPIRVPRVHVDWYKKAYDNAVMFSKPTVMQTAAGLKGFGDGSGPEIVMGLNKLRELVGSTSTGNTINIYATPGMNVNQLADAVQARLAALERQKMRAWA